MHNYIALASLVVACVIAAFFGLVGELSLSEYKLISLFGQGTTQSSLPSTMSTRLSSLIENVNSLTPVQQRKVAALIGSIVADAASRPLHWLYDQTKLDSIIGNQDPEFWPESHAMFSTLPLGSRSCYSDECVSSLRSLSRTGELDLEGLCKQLYEDFGMPDSPYQRALPLRKDGIPVKGPWIQGALIKFLEGYITRGCSGLPGNPDSLDMDSFCVSLPIIVRYAGNQSLSNFVLRAAKLVSVSPLALDTTMASAAILEGYIQGDDPEAVIIRIKDGYPIVAPLIQAVESARDKDHTVSVAEFGKTCPVPGSFQGALLAVMTSESYVDGVRKNIRAGGDNCGRSNIIGSCLGSKYGFSSIPLEWLLKTTNIDDMMEMAIKLAMV